MISPSRLVSASIVRMEVLQRLEPERILAAWRYGPHEPFILSVHTCDREMRFWLLGHTSRLVKFHLINEALTVITQLHCATAPGQSGLERKLSHLKLWASPGYVYTRVA